jgi:hypothetical protein
VPRSNLLHMDQAWTPLLSTLVGGASTLIGGWLATTRQQRGQLEQTKRADPRVVIGEFLVQTDLLWRAVDGVVTVVRTMPVNGPANEWQQTRWREDSEDRRVRSLASAHAFAAIELVCPPL